ncbi:MAG: tRNA-dihydrouridine synthase family protein [Muribaculaceae bacterium]|nr:tRNA-dihydrouridine synthase family protein [Muribaculaceae bacterium]
MEKEFKLMVAPMQGLTEAAWRSVHFRLFGEGQRDVEYFTPFIRVEKGEVRARDLRDFTSGLNVGMRLTPQIIFRDVEEWRMLVETLATNGAERIDLNMGCPFVPQVRKGRGAGILNYPDKIAQIANEMTHYTDIQFSVKMRLGVDDPGEALALVELLNEMPLRHVTVHPRTAKQQYKGNLLLEDMKAFSSKLRHPVIFNGEISTPMQIEELAQRYDGVMIGRGILARPSLFAEYRSGREWSVKDREEAFLSLLRNTSSVLEDILCGSAQLRDKMKPYWEYAPATLDKKIVKQGKKSGSV